MSLDRILFIIAFSLLFFPCMGYAVYTVLRFWKVIGLGQKEIITTPLLFRLKSVFVNVFLQKKLFKHPVRGIFHVLIFYSFILYSLLHTPSQIIGGFLGDPTFYIPSFIDVFVPSFSFFYDYLIDLFSFFVLFSVLFFGMRRWVFRAKELDRPSLQSFFVLIFIGMLMLFTLIGEPAKMFAYPNLLIDASHSSFIRAYVQDLYLNFGWSDVAVAKFIYLLGWWGHISSILFFAAFVPNSKHAHLIWAPVNFFFASDRPKGALSHLDVENATVWGASNTQHFAWTTLLDGLACIECGRCTIECPASRTGKVLNPKEIMKDIKHAVMDHAPNLLAAVKNGSSGEDFLNLKGTRVIDDYTSQDAIWGCTTCYACVEACPVGNNHVEAILNMRRSLVLNEGALPSELQGALINMENQSNPWGIGSHKRVDWIEGLEIRTMAEWKTLGEEPDLLFWVGCAGSFDERNIKIARSIANLLNKANVKFGILGLEENCSGDSARRSGNEYLWQQLAQMNIDKMHEYSIKMITTGCPHCFNTIKNEYPELGGNFEVIHHSELINQLLDDKCLHVDQDKAKEIGSVTYHDSCYLGRYNNNYEHPRSVLKHVTGTAVLEPSDHHSKGLCCGAGGAQMWMEEQNSDRVNIKRTEQLVKTTAKTVASGCPFCITMIGDGIKSKELESSVNILDIAEIVDRSTISA